MLKIYHLRIDGSFSSAGKEMMRVYGTRLIMTMGVMLLCGAVSRAEEGKLKVLIVDGQNNHSWYKTTPVMKEALEKADRFDVEVLTSPAAVPRKPRLRKEHEADEAKVEAWEKAVEKWKKRLPQLKVANEEAWKTEVLPILCTAKPII